MSAGRQGARGAQGGFSLVELMVALVLFATIVGTVLAMLLNVQRSWSTSRDLMVSHQNERAGVDLMVRDIRMAGTGFAGRPIVTGGVPGNVIYPLQPTPGSGVGDTLTVTAAFAGLHSTSSANMGSASDVLRLASVAGFQVDDLVIITNGVEANMFQVTDIDVGANTLGHSTDSPYNNPGGHTVWPAGGYVVGATVVKVNRVTYWVDDTGAVPLLRRQTGNESPLTVASDIDGMRFMYVCADGTESTSPSDPSLVRSVLLQYLSPSANAECGEGGSDTLSVRIQPRVLG
jgi:prepilin-type N-terminal cleavage/methylation domain-containing protein